MGIWLGPASLEGNEAGLHKTKYADSLILQLHFQESILEKYLANINGYIYKDTHVPAVCL